MLQYLLKRLLLLIPTFLGITLVTFLMIKIAPGDPVSMKMELGEGTQAYVTNQEVINQVRKLYDLDAPLPAWYESIIQKSQNAYYQKSLRWLGDNLVQYFRWVNKILHFDFGNSLKSDRRPVLEKIAEALPITLALNFLEIFIAYIIAIPLGVHTALKKNSMFDKGSMLTLFVLYSLPSFWVATLLILFFASGEYLNLFPLGGILSEGMEMAPVWMKFGNMVWHLCLPLICMVYGSLAFLTRFSRNNFLEVIQQDYIRTARANGLPENKVVWRYAFKNSLLPLITLMGTLLPALMGGSVIIEQIFSIPGMGYLGFQSILARDYPTLMAITSIEALLTLFSLLLVDFVYVWIDPRIHFEKVGS